MVNVTASAATNRVLWIGNSYSGYGEVWKPVQAAVNAACPEFQIAVEANLRGGANMKMHFEKQPLEKNPLHWIKTRDYNIVLIQGGASLYLDDRKAIFHEYMPLFINAAKERGAKVILAGTWSTARSIEGTQVQIDFYREAHKQFDTAYAPVGEAWKTVLTEKPEWGMYVDDTGHPSTLGVYLNSCVYYAVFSGKSPEGLNLDIPEIPVKEENRSKYADGKNMTLSAEAKACLERIAWQTVQPYQEQNQRVLRGTHD